MDKLFAVAGTSKLDGTVKFRVANGTAAARTKVLANNGHSEINLQDLPKSMTKEDALIWIQTNSKTTLIKASVEKVAKNDQKKSNDVVLEKVPAVVDKNSSTKTSKKDHIKSADKPKLVPLAPVSAAPSVNSISEITRIKSNNLEKMRAVTRKLQALRAF